MTPAIVGGGLVDDLVSVITPAYEVEALIGECIESVRGQTYDRWEHIIVDDASVDATVDVATRHAAEDQRVRVLRLQQNRGPAAARNRALAEAKGRFVAFLDADDLWMPEKLEQQLEVVRREGSCFVFTAYRQLSEDGMDLSPVVDVPERMTYSDMLKNTAIVTSTMLVDRAEVGPIKMKHTYYDDLALKLELLRRGIEARGIGEDLVHYRLVEGSVSDGKLNSARWVWRTYRDIEGLSLPYAVWCFANYAWNASRKY